MKDYRTVSLMAILVLDSVPPVDLLMDEVAKIKIRLRTETKTEKHKIK